MVGLLPNQLKDVSQIAGRFTRLYLTILAMLATLLTAGQVLIQVQYGVIQKNMSVLRHTGLQRHQSQQLVKLVLQITDANEQASFTQHVAELGRLVPIFERYHLQTRQGQSDDPRVRVTNSAAIQQLYTSIRPQFEALQQSGHRLMQLRHVKQVHQPAVQASVRHMLANEQAFLQKIDAIVVAFNSEVRAKLTALQSIERYSYMLSLITLVAIGVLIFRPAVRSLKQAFSQLVDTERQTATTNQQLVSAYHTLKEARLQLVEATKAQYQQRMEDRKRQTAYLIAGQEEERKRFSRDLHDGLGQMLIAIKLQIEGLEAGLAKTTTTTDQTETLLYTRRLTTLKGLALQTIQETRAISNNLMPSVLSDYSVVSAIKMLVETTRNATVALTFKTNFMPAMLRLDKHVEIMLYRVTQEAVSNAVRHAQPSSIHIDLIKRVNELHLVIRDDGNGFRVASKKHPKRPDERTGSPQRTLKIGVPSQGLRNIEERVNLFNGQFRINSTVGKGTQIQVTIPYVMD